MITIDEWNNYVYKSLLLWGIIFLGAEILTLFDNALNAPSVNNVGYLLFVILMEISLIVMFIRDIANQYFDKELKNKLNYSKRLLDNRTVRYERVVITHDSFQFKLKRGMDKVLLKELMYISKTHMEVKETDYGTWLIIYWIRDKPKQDL